MPTKFDSVDERILQLLRTNGRRTKTDLARQLGITEGAIRKKLQKLTTTGLLKIVAMADSQKLGYTIDVFCGIQVTPGKTFEVAERLISLEPVRYAALVTGTYDILFEAMFRHQDELLDFLTKTLPAVEGLTRTETWHVLKVVKRNYDILSVTHPGANHST